MNFAAMQGGARARSRIERAQEMTPYRSAWVSLARFLSYPHSYQQVGGVGRADCRYRASALVFGLLLKGGHPEDKKPAMVRIVERRGGCCDGHCGSRVCCNQAKDFLDALLYPPAAEKLGSAAVRD